MERKKWEKKSGKKENKTKQGEKASLHQTAKHEGGWGDGVAQHDPWPDLSPVSSGSHSLGEETMGSPRHSCLSGGTRRLF